jgi:hypothetical protein
MNEQPISRAETAAKARKRKELLEDSLYYGGAAVLAIGRALPARWSSAIETIGFFLILPPALALASGFVRGLLVRPQSR